MESFDVDDELVVDVDPIAGLASDLEPIEELSLPDVLASLPAARIAEIREALAWRLGRRDDPNRSDADFIEELVDLARRGRLRFSRRHNPTLALREDEGDLQETPLEELSGAEEDAMDAAGDVEPPDQVEAGDEIEEPDVFEADDEIEEPGA